MLPLEAAPPPDTPWWGWLIAVAIPGVVSVVVTLITRRHTKGDIAEIKSVADRSIDQLENTHTTNLRDDLDRLITIVSDGQAAIRDDIGGLHSETRDLRQDVEGIRSDNRHDRRRVTAAIKDLEDHLEDAPRIAERAIAEHEQRWHQPPS